MDELEERVRRGGKHGLDDHFDLTLQNVASRPDTVDDIHRYVKGGNKVLLE